MKNKKSKGKSNIKEKLNKIINDTISIKKKKKVNIFVVLIFLIKTLFYSTEVSFLPALYNVARQTIS